MTIDRGRIDEPQICPNQACQRRGTMTLVHNRCSYLDKQLVKVCFFFFFSGGLGDLACYRRVYVCGLFPFASPK